MKILQYFSCQHVGYMVRWIYITVKEIFQRNMNEVVNKKLIFSQIKLESLNNECYQRIKNAILTGQFLWGERLDVGQIAAEFGISKFPVIKAINRLAMEYLVIIVPNKGSFVMTPSKHSIDEVIEIREMIELNAWELSCRKNSSKLIKMLEEIENRQTENIPHYYRGQKFKEFLEYDREFHMSILLCAENERLLNYYEGIRSQVELFRVKSHDNSNWKRAHSNHGKILSLLKNGEIEKAKNLLKTHLDQVHDEILDTLKEG